MMISNINVKDRPLTANLGYPKADNMKLIDNIMPDI